MPRIDAVVTCPIYSSFRVEQVAGMFDVPLEARATERFSIEVPEHTDDWQIGLIVGPSGSGKTTIARQLFGAALGAPVEWPADRAVVDCFGDLPMRQITGLFTAVGFGSPPSWIRPYGVLSGGERFRCDLARALASACAGNRGEPSGPAWLGPSSHPTIAFDEYTSVVDRNVARVGSAALAKAIRGGLVPCRFVGVTCHYDIAEWLEPDWLIDMATGTFQRRRLRRPRIDLEVFRCRRAMWRMFARHHYLTGSLSTAARSFVACWQGVAVAFCATISLIGKKGRWRISRLVTLPDYQGIGIGTHLAEAVAELHRARQERVNITAAHPALIAHCRRSPRWRAVCVRNRGNSAKQFIANYRASAGRAVVSFEYIGSAAA